MMDGFGIQRRQQFDQIKIIAAKRVTGFAGIGRKAGLRRNNSAESSADALADYRGHGSSAAPCRLSLRRFLGV